jgi:hypothetical protein
VRGAVSLSKPIEHGRFRHILHHEVVSPRDERGGLEGCIRRLNVLGLIARFSCVILTVWIGHPPELGNQRLLWGGCAFKRNISFANILQVAGQL